mmetsp:Transcript_36024/g.86270  ORF Transcript_36024/g.86270 Transcript_36024/m.86270 type:complete len:177 (-) Transcript_36024:440-970(-)
MFDGYIVYGTILGEHSFDDYIVYQRHLLSHILHDAILIYYPIFGIFHDCILHCANEGEHMLCRHSVSNDIRNNDILHVVLLFKHALCPNIFRSEILHSTNLCELNRCDHTFYIDILQDYTLRRGLLYNRPVDITCHDNVVPVAILYQQVLSNRSNRLCFYVAVAKKHILYDSSSYN